MRARPAHMALIAAPFLAAGAGVVAATLNARFDVERNFAAGGHASSCVEAGAGPERLWPAPLFADGGEGWHMELFADAAACSQAGRFAECRLRGPARLTYAGAGAARAYDIQAIGEHRVRANRRGLSCRRMN